MKSKKEELIRILDSLVELLKSEGETHWATWMSQARTLLRSSDFSGIARLLAAYGGMGSFNDLILCQGRENGVFAWKKGHIEKNEKLSLLRSRAWDLAEAIRREQERDPD